MSLQAKLMAVGMPAATATQVAGDVASSLTAAGTTQTDALKLSCTYNYVTTVSSGAGVQLYGSTSGKPASIGDEQTVYNAGANALNVYPPSGEQILGVSTNAAFSIPTSSKLKFKKVTNTLWIASETFVQSGIGAITTETVQAALRRLCFSGQYDTAAHFTTAVSALTDTAGFGGIQSIGTAKIGRGVALGQPTGTLTVSANGAGGLTGTYQYAYTETDGTGETNLSATASIVAASNTVRIVVPEPRRGVSQRRLWRTKAGGSSFFLLHDFGGGNGYFQTTYDDNIADGSIVTAAPTSDTTQLFAIEVNNSVKYLRTHPDQGSAAADWTVLTGDNGNTTGAYCFDVYGEYLGRTYLGNTFGSLKTGSSGTHLLARWQDVVDNGSSPSTVAQLMPKGNLLLTPQTLSDPGAADSMANGINIAATVATTNTATVTANLISITGAGSSAFSQTALSVGIAAGYTGSSPTYAVRGGNTTASTGTSFGNQGGATGASALNVGLNGMASGATKNIGVFGTSAGVDLGSTALTFPGGVAGIAGAFSNGGNTDDILGLFDNVTNVFRFTDNGGFVGSGLSSNTSTTYDFNTSGKGNFRILANGNTNIQIGSTNNVPVLLNTNGTLALTVTTGQLAQFVNSVAAYSATAIPAGGTAGAGFLVSSTANFGIFFGSGAPTLSAAQGSLYIRSDGSSTSTRLYVNSSAGSGTTWTNVTTAT